MGSPSGVGSIKKKLNTLRCLLIKSIRKTAKKTKLNIPGPLGVEEFNGEDALTVDNERTVSIQKMSKSFPDDHPLFQMPAVVCPRSWVRKVDMLTILGPTIGVISAKRQLIPEVSIEWSCPPDKHWTFRKLMLPSPKYLSGMSLILASTGGDSYFHWMTDVLPRVRLAERAGYEVEHFDHFIVNKVKTDYQKETLKYLKIPFNRLREISRKANGYLCQRSVLPSLPSYPGAVPLETIQYVRSIIPETPTRKGVKLYIERGKSKRRRISDETRIIEWLQTKSFMIIDCGEMSVADQAAAFAHAELIVAPHGGALTNLMFCREGTKVVELLSSKYPNPCYRNLCGVAGLPYIGIIGNNQKSESTCDLSDSSGVIETSLEDLKKVLDQISAC